MEEITYLFKSLGLECPIASIEPLLGGQLHRVFLVRTGHHAYVVKWLNPIVITKPEFPDNYEQSERVAEHFETVGIHAVAALSFDGHFVQRVGQQFFLVYPYREGRLLKAKDISPQHGHAIGLLFAGCHAHGAAFAGTMKVDWHVHNAVCWHEMLSKAALWLDRSTQKMILRWIEAYQEALIELNQNLVVSHRDLHYGNVIWDHDERPHLVDWESAGIINPWAEVIGYGLEWAGIMQGVCHGEIFDALWKSYIQQSGAVCAYPQAAFYGWLGHCLLPWLYFNLERALGTIKQEPEATKRGQEALNGGLLRCLYFLERNQDHLVNRLIL